jgi:hypothetical protein
MAHQPPIPGARIGSDPQQAQQQAQQAVRDAFARQAKNCPLLDGVLVGPVRLGVSYAGDGTPSPRDTEFRHGLGRPARGWIVVDRTNLGDLWRSDAVNKAPTSTLLLSHNVTTPVLVTLWVF